MINIEEVISRLKLQAGVSNNKEVADLLGLSAADFSNRKTRGTLLPLIIDWAINENVNIDWLLKGSHIQTEPNLVTEKINLMLADMSEEKRRDVLKYTEEKKLLADLLNEKNGMIEAKL